MRNTAIFLVLLLMAGCAKKPEYKVAPVVKDEIAINISTLTGKIPVFFSYINEGKRYDFFVQSVDGEIRAFLDACFKCAPKQKGFETERGRLRCRACDESFPLENLSGIGSCYPIPLIGEVREGTYFVSIDQLIAKTKYPMKDNR